jgi:hypothetical protein
LPARFHFDVDPLLVRPLHGHFTGHGHALAHAVEHGLELDRAAGQFVEFLLPAVRLDGLFDQRARISSVVGPRRSADRQNEPERHHRVPELCHLRTPRWK